ncbi:MAG: penicillin-binding protein [Fibrobacteres bacterium]|nr:penicillin-binding protein [Fibrobacterota bacterium]
MISTNRRVQTPDQNGFRIKVLVAVNILIAALLLGRFFLIQVVRAPFYARMGEIQSLREVNIMPDRGRIFDRDGVCLAVNMALDSVNRIQLSKIISSNGGTPPKRSLKRLYPLKTTAGHMIGFVGRDGYGLGGVEFGFDRELYGEAGWALARQDAKARRVYEPDLPVKEAVGGLSVKLTLDVDVQEILESCLQNGINNTKAAGGAIIIMDPFTGDVLGMASYPFFDPNFFIKPSETGWRNNGIGMVYEPGSTFKIIAAAAALEENAYNEEDVITTDGGQFHIYNQVIKDAHAHGDLTFRQAVAVSSNVAFAKIAMTLGERTYYKYVRNFGFGQKLGIDLPGEEAGLLKPVEKWSGRTLVTISMGQEIGTTLIQMGAAYCAIANGGILLLPRVVSGMYDNGRLVKDVPVRPIRRVVSEKTAKRLTQCLMAVVESDSGTGTLARISGVTVAGKTGTAQKIDPVSRRYVNGKYVASFAGFFPAEAPKLLCMVILDEPQGAYYGGTTAGPVFREAVTRILHSQNLPYGAQIFGRNFTSVEPSVEKTIVPDFRKLDIESAISMAELAGVRICLEGQGDTIQKQSVKKGAEVLKGSVITLQIMTDTTIVKRHAATIPDVMGLSLRDAVKTLLFNGIQVKITGEGRVLRQIPEPGTASERNTVCVLEAG